jgi:arabinan endo-1,5-alpha-L-arabinosidase
MSWTQVANDDNAARLYGSSPGWQTILADAFTHVGNDSDGDPPGSTWAPDVIKLGGIYYMYYSLSTWGSNKSYIGRVEANSVTGPYSNSVEVLKTPATSSTGSAPNAIDPAFFYDKDGKLWMSYGSFFNGIYILEMETSGAQIGLPKTGQGNYGTRIWNGGNGPEGPYIFYNPTTDYYYLMVSHGSLSDSYNMRVARSRNPNGPYTDIQGRNVGNINAAGNKLAGNYRFAGASRGYAALGHNSVLVENDKYFVIYHTRFSSNTGVSVNHNQFVNQLFFNSDGWPVMAPNRYAGENLGCVSAASIVGEYDVVVHTPIGNSVNFVNSVAYTFNANGEVRQGNTLAGSWSRTGDYYFVVTIGNVTYNGVMAPQYNIDLNYAELSFTGVSEQGNSMWANKRL